MGRNNRTGGRGLLVGLWLGFVTMLGACATQNPDNIPEFQSLQRQIVWYYDNRAWERNATCLQPEMGLTESRVTQETAEQLVLEVRYIYDDRTYGRRQGSFPSGNDCFGTGTRTFVVAKVTGGGYSVTSMSGPQRE